MKSRHALPLALSALICACDDPVGATEDPNPDAATSLDVSITEVSPDGSPLPEGGVDAVSETGVDASSPPSDTSPTDTTPIPPGDAGGLTPGPADAIIAAMPPGSWKRLTGTEMKDVCPTPYNHYLCGAVMNSWSGGAYDHLRDRLIVFGGGHDDSPYNNVFTFDLASMKWQRRSELPAGIGGDSVTDVERDKRIETCGLYPSGKTLTIPDAWLGSTGYLMESKCDDASIVPQLDPQQPRSRHTYGNIAFSGASGQFHILGAVALYPTGQSGTARTMSFSFGSNSWTRGSDNPEPGFGTSATDVAGHIWYMASGGSDHLLEYDPVADKWTVHTSESHEAYYGAADVDTKRKVLVSTTDGTKLATYAIGTAAATYTAITPTGLSPKLGSAPGMAYSPVLDRFVAWSGGAGLAMLDPVTWKWTRVTGTGDDPGVPAANGTFGRFRYSPSRDVFVLVNSTETDVYLYKAPKTAP